MNLLPRWTAAVAALLPLVVGCAQQTVAQPTAEETAPVISTRTKGGPGSKAESKLDCCAPPQRSRLFAAALRTEQKPSEVPTNRSTGSVSINDVLQPTGPAASWVLEKQPRKILPPPRFLEQPEAGFPPIAADLIRAPMELSVVVLFPRALPEDTLLAAESTEQKLPERQPLAVQPLVRLPQVDLEKPVELPPQARFQQDRIPFTDVTGEASLEAVLALPIPVRATPEPFVPINLPEPFEFRNTRLPPPVEDK